MVGSITLSGKEYRWLFSVRASQLFNDLYGKPEETTDRLKAFELNTRFLYCCIKASDELRLIDGQETQLVDMGIGAFELLLCEGNNEVPFANFLTEFSNNITDKKKVKEDV